ncbi:MAG: hypothetical protein ACR2HN_11915, partial [Tepidiformaceae bacterium]
LGGAIAAAAATPATSAAPTVVRGGQRPPRSTPGEPPEQRSDATPEQRFIRDLYLACSQEDARIGGMLNGSCEVLRMEGDLVELGFYYTFHLDTVANKGRALVEQQASKLLNRPVTLEVRQIERQKAQPRQAPRGGHLAEAARAIGATPVNKEN